MSQSQAPFPLFRCGNLDLGAKSVAVTGESGIPGMRGRVILEDQVDEESGQRSW